MPLQTVDITHSSNWFTPSELWILLVMLGFIITFFGIAGRYCKYYLLLNEAMVCLALGFVFGNFFTLYNEPILNPGTWFSEIILVHVVMNAGRLTLTTQYVSTALRLPRYFTAFAWKQLLALSIFTLSMTWLTSTFITWVVFHDFLPHFYFREYLLVGALFCAPDLVVSSLSLTGSFAKKRLSMGLRFLYSTESAVDDVFVFLYVSLGVLISTHKSPTDILNMFWLNLFLYKLVLPLILGVTIGLATGWLVNQIEERPVDKKSFVAFSLGYSLFLLSFFRIFGMASGNTTFFTCLALTWMYPHHKLRHENGKVQEAFDTIVTCTFFFLMGTAFPFAAVFDLGWRGVVLSLMIIFLRRPLWILLVYFLLRPYVRSFLGEGIFYAFHNPIGVSSIVYGAYAALSLRNFGHPHWQFFWTITMETAAISTFLQGASTTLAQHAIVHIEQHREKLYEFLHLPLPHPLRGVVECPKFEYIDEEERLISHNKMASTHSDEQEGGQQDQHSIQSEDSSSNNSSRVNRDTQSQPQEEGDNSRRSQNHGRQEGQEIQNTNQENLSDYESRDGRRRFRERKQNDDNGSGLYFGMWAGRPRVGILKCSVSKIELEELTA